MTDWPVMDREWQINNYDPYQYAPYPHYEEKMPQQQQCSMSPAPAPTPVQQYFLPPSPGSTPLFSHFMPSSQPATPALHDQHSSQALAPRPDNPREIRNKAEKQRRDKLNHSIGELAAMVPPVVASSRKIDKTGVLRLTAHYLRAHQYVFGDSIGASSEEFSASSMQALLGLLNGFLLTTTYKGLIVVVSQNVQDYLGYTELELLGQNIFNITYEEDRQMLREQLIPKTQILGLNGELIIPDEPDGKQKVAKELANEKRRFVVRFKKLGQRSVPCQYVTCHVEGSLRKSDRACRGYNRCCQMVRRARARGDNPCSSGNDIVFIGIVRPTKETFHTESHLESFRMEYRTRHLVDGEIVQCEQRIGLVTGYMIDEVIGVNAMNFMHRDDVRWVIITLREMYDQNRLYGESCYRLITKNGQFIYMRTRGRLDVNQDSKAVTTFVCTNTVVDEQEGKHLIKMMKKKFSMIVDYNEEPAEIEDIKDTTDNQTLAVEDPQQLQKIILHLVTNLPSPDETSRCVTPDKVESRLAIIPPKKERIINAIGKMYNVFKDLQKPSDVCIEHRENEVNGVEIPQNNNLNVESDTTNSLLPHSTSHNILPSNMINNKSQSIQYVQYNEETRPSKLISCGTTNCSQELPKHKLPMNLDSNDIQNIMTTNTSAANTLTACNSNNIIEDNSDKLGEFIPPSRKIKYHVLITPRISVKRTQQNNTQEDSNKTLLLQVHQPGPSTIVAGVKRINPCEDQEIISTKKISDGASQTKQIVLDPGQNSLSLENFFDEALLNTQIESAISSLEQAIDPMFPDLLISAEVQDILGEIEEDAGQNTSVNQPE